MKDSRRIITLLIVASMSATATAHPGHGEPGPMHYLTQPQHLFTLALFFAAITAILSVAVRFKRQISTVAEKQER